MSNEINNDNNNQTNNPLQNFLKAYDVVKINSKLSWGQKDKFRDSMLKLHERTPELFDRFWSGDSQEQKRAWEEIKQKSSEGNLRIQQQLERIGHYYNNDVEI